MTEAYQDCILIARTELEWARQRLQDDIQKLPNADFGV